MTDTETQNPRVGMMAIVRGKRRAVISEVRPFLGEDQILHVVRVEYKDDEFPDSEELIWEREPFRKLLEPTALPKASDPPMQGDDFNALLSSARWSALMPYLDPDEDGPLSRLPFCAPFHGAVQVEDYQLVPLLKAIGRRSINRCGSILVRGSTIGSLSKTLRSRGVNATSTPATSSAPAATKPSSTN